ncbi:MAG: peptidase C11, partial [Eubacterium sp.]|nr:peptidase C11 [Eubacterium sp.]
MDNIPEGRKKRVTGVGKGVHKKGEGLGTGPVGSGKNQMNSQKPGGAGPDRDYGGGGGGGRSPLSLLLILIVVALFGGKSILGGLGDMGGGGGGTTTTSNSGTGNSYYTNSISQNVSQSPGWKLSSNIGQLDKSVADGSRAKYTNIKGNGNDTVTIMLYMCGTDLESRSGMATSDLVEMANAKLSDKINLIV